MRSQIRRELLRRIVGGMYQPGDRLVELQIAREFNTSQAPVREALRELEALRLVECESYRGTRVRALSEREHREAAEVRGVLEAAAARHAVGVLRGNTGRLREEFEAIARAARAHDLDAYARHNTAFHRLIIEAADNEVMLRVWDSLMLEARTRIGLGTFETHLDLNAAAATHGPIVDAFEAGDGERAGRMLIEHAESFSVGRQPRTDDLNPDASTLPTSAPAARPAKL